LNKRFKTIANALVATLKVAKDVHRPKEAVLTNTAGLIDWGVLQNNVFEVLVDGKRIHYATYTDGVIVTVRHGLPKEALEIENWGKRFTLVHHFQSSVYQVTKYNKVSAVEDMDLIILSAQIKGAKSLKAARPVKDIAPMKPVVYLGDTLGTHFPGSVTSCSSYATTSSVDPALKFLSPVCNSSASTPRGEGDCGLPLFCGTTQMLIGIHAYGPTKDGTFPYNGALLVKAAVDRFKNISALNGTPPAKSS